MTEEVYYIRRCENLEDFHMKLRSSCTEFERKSSENALCARVQFIQLFYWNWNFTTDIVDKFTSITGCVNNTIVL